MRPSARSRRYSRATETHLQKHGIRLLQFRRTYDSVIWPHARRGYFKLKDKIPSLLDSLGIETEGEFQDSRSEAG